MRTWNAGTVMTEELRIWSVDDGGKAEPLSPLKQMPTELEFEELLVTNPEMLEPGLRMAALECVSITIRDTYGNVYAIYDIVRDHFMVEQHMFERRRRCTPTAASRGSEDRRDDSQAAPKTRPFITPSRQGGDSPRFVNAFEGGAVTPLQEWKQAGASSADALLRERPAGDRLGVRDDAAAVAVLAVSAGVGKLSQP